jgi:hypothetical protein
MAPALPEKAMGGGHGAVIFLPCPHLTLQKWKPIPCLLWFAPVASEGQARGVPHRHPVQTLWRHSHPQSRTFPPPPPTHTSPPPLVNDSGIMATRVCNVILHHPFHFRNLDDETFLARCATASHALRMSLHLSSYSSAKAFATLLETEVRTCMARMARMAMSSVPTLLAALRSRHSRRWRGDFPRKAPMRRRPRSCT